MPETQNAGATPVAEGATPSQTPEPTTAAPATPATGEPEALGEAGTRALAAERKRANDAEKASKALQARIEELENATRSDTDKAIAQAKKDGAAEVTERFHAQVRRAEVKAALTAGGINPAFLDLATKADEFASLPVDDDGAVKGLNEAVEAFKKAMPDMFRTTAKPDFGGGPRGTPPSNTPTMNELLRAASRPG